MQNQIFEVALGIANPWYIKDVEFDAEQKSLSIHIDFIAGSRFAYPGVEGVHPVHDTQIKRYRHLNFFQHECHLDVRVPQFPGGRIALVEPDWAGKLNGFTLLFEALVLMLARQMPFAVVARIVGESWHRVYAICAKYVELAVDAADLSDVCAVAIDETSCQRGHDYLTLVADAEQRKVIFVSDGKDAKTVESFAEYLSTHGGDASQIDSTSIDMSPAFIKGVTDQLPNARITFDKFHVIAHASTAVDKMRRAEQKTDSDLKGLRWALLKDRSNMNASQCAYLDALITHITTKRTARTWLYREQLREVLERKQINVVSSLLAQWCTNVIRSKVELMKEVAKIIRSHFNGIVTWAQTR